MKKQKTGLSMIVTIVIILVIAVLITVGIIIVTNNSKTNTDVTNNNGVVTPNHTNNNNNIQNNNENVNNNNTNVNLTSTYKVPGRNIYVDVPNYQEIEKGFTQLYIMHGQRYVAVTVDKNTEISSIEQAHEAAFEKFKQNIQNYSYVNSLKVEKSSTEIINGMEVYKYEGTLNCGRDNVYDAYVIGYSFIFDGEPCNIIGSVIDEGQSEEWINEIRSTVETMIKTVRTER